MSDELVVTFPHGPSIPVITRVDAAAREASEYVASPWVGLYYKKDFKTREQFSPSQIESARGCELAWGYRYIWGLRVLEIDFNSADLAKLKGRDRSLAFGKAMHVEGETYYTTGRFDDSTLPGRAFLSGLHLLPHPTDCEQIEVELGIDQLPGLDVPRFVGFKDLVARYAGQWYLFDYKSTRDFQWMKTEAQLQKDLAASLYGLDLMRRESITELPGRWVYFKSEGRPQARPTDLRLFINQAAEVVEEGLIVARHLLKHLRAHTMPADLVANPNNCKSYGGCPYRKSVGGPCDGEHTGVFLLGTALANMLPQSKGEIQNMPAPDQLPGESDVTYKIRMARNKAAQGAQGQPTAPAAPPPGFAAPPPQFLTPPPQAQATMLAPQQPAPFPLPQGAVGAPIVAHVLPPESAQPQAQMQAPPDAFPAPPPVQQTYLPPPPAVLAAPPPPAEPAPAPAKRRGRPAGSKNTQPPAGSTLTPSELLVSEVTEISISLGSSTIVVTSDSADDARGLAELIQGLLA